MADGCVRVTQLVATGSNGGAQEHVAALLAGLDPGRYSMNVITLSDGNSVDRWKAIGVPVEVLHDRHDGRLAEAVADRLGSFGAQVLHDHMYRAEVVGARAALCLRQRGEPPPFVIGHVHSSRLRRAGDRAVLDALDDSVDRLVAVSRAIEAKLSAERPHRPPVELIYNGVDLQRFSEGRDHPSVRAELGIPVAAPLVGCVARLEPEKGQRTLLEAWPEVVRAVPEAHLLIVGEGSRGRELRAMAGPGVILCGRRDDIPAVTAAIDVAVLPSNREAQGLAILEAMAMTRPVVASRVGGIPEMIEDGVTGLLVPPREPAALAAAIVRVLRDPDLAGRMAQAGNELVRARFPVERMLRAVAALYEEGASTWRERSAALGFRPSGRPARDAQPTAG